MCFLLYGDICLGDACDYHDAPFEYILPFPNPTCACNMAGNGPGFLWQYPPCCLSADHPPPPLCPSLQAPTYLRDKYGGWGSDCVCLSVFTVVSFHPITHASSNTPSTYCTRAIGQIWTCMAVAVSTVVSVQQITHPCPFPLPTCAIWRIWAWQWLCPPWCPSSRSPIPAPSSNLPVQYGGYGPGCGCVHHGVSPADHAGPPLPLPPTYLCNMADMGLAVAVSTVVSLQQITHRCPFPQPTCAIWRIWAWLWLCPPWCLSSRSCRPTPVPSPNLPAQYGGYGPGSGCVHRGVSPADHPSLLSAPSPQPTCVCNMADMGLAVAVSTVVSLQQISHPCPFPQPTTCAIWRIWAWWWLCPPWCLSSRSPILAPSPNLPVQYGGYGPGSGCVHRGVSPADLPSLPLPPTYLCNMADMGLAVAVSTVVSLQQITHPCPFPQPTCAIWRTWAWRWLCPPWCLSSRSPIPAPSPNLPVQYGGYGPGGDCIHRGVSPADHPSLPLHQTYLCNMADMGLAVAVSTVVSLQQISNSAVLDLMS
jgi:hypothetical protein